jgi:hypothetical protein
MLKWTQVFRVLALIPSTLYHNIALAIVAGNVLRGKIVIKVLATLPPTLIQLRLAGKEKSSVRDRTGNRNRFHQAERRICSATTELWNVSDRKIQPGTHVFPFEFELPPSLPSSMFQQEPDVLSSCCSIIYKLKIDATPQGRDMLRGLAQRPFGIASGPLSDTRIPDSVGPRTIQVNSLGGVDRGTISIAARVLDVQVGRGTKLQIFLACRNDATASIYRVEIALVETVDWKAGKAGSRYSTLTTRTIASKNDVDLPGILRGKQDKQTVRELRLQGGVQNEELEFLFQELDSARNRVTLKVPTTGRDSYKGALIRVSHTLQITAYTKSMISNPCVKLPLHIGYPPELLSFNETPSESHIEAIAFPVPNSSYSTSQPPTNGTDSASPFYPMPVAAAHRFESSDQPGIGTSLSVPNLPDVDIPMAEAIVIPIDQTAVQAPIASTPPEAMILGGLVTYQDTEISSTDGVTPLSYISQTADVILSLESLLQQMISSIDDYLIISEKLQQSEWRLFLASISPEDFGNILAHVHRDTDQPRIAQALAQHAFGDRFTCEYGRAAIRNSADWNRPAMIQSTLPFCVDRRTQFPILQDELSDWERTVTQSDFERWIQADS